MKRPFHSGCANGVILAILFFSATPLDAHPESERYEGRRLADALRTLQGRGLRIVFSSATVTPNMRVLIEPRAKVARQILDELLEPHDLKAEEGPGGVIQVVRAKPAIHLRKPLIPTRTGTIQGQVIDAATGSSLPGVLVQVSDASRSVRTNAEGRFQVPEVQSGIQTLEVSIAGYALVRRTIPVTGGRTLSVEIYLAPESGSYRERVIVKASWLERRDPGVGSEVRLGGDELRNLRGVLADDPMRAAHAMPRVATGDDFRSEFSVRGSPYRHVGVVVDGVATPWLQHAVYGDYDTGSISMLTSDALEQTTLRAGAYPHRYGDRLGAELDLTLRQGSRVARQLHGTVSGTNASVITEGPIGRSERGSWLFTLRRSYLDWPIRQLGESSLTAFDFADAQAKLVYDVRPSQQVSFTFLGGRSRVDERGDRGPQELAESTNRAAMLSLGWRSTFGLANGAQPAGSSGGSRVRQQEPNRPRQGSRHRWRALLSY
jgi:CarboxypepD_reg-like domain